MNAKVVSAVVALLAVLGVGAVALYLNRDVAAEADIDTALSALDRTEADVDPTPAEVSPTETLSPDAAEPEIDSSDADADPTEPGPTAVGAPDGQLAADWVVDTSVGSFDFGETTATFVGFRVDEVLNTVGETEAIGRTPAVTGTMTVDGATVTAVDVTADVTQMVSDVSRRDGAMRRAMGVDANPEATFALTEPIDLGSVPDDGERITATAVGDLTVNGTTQPVQLELEAQRAEGRIVVVGRAPVTFADFGITAPRAGPVVEIDDEGTLELQLWFTPA